MAGLLVFFALLVGLSSLFLPLKFIVVEGTLGRPISFFLVRDGDRIEISHINSIYDSHVNEILRVAGEELEVIRVETHSYGVKEYYGISDGFSPRKYKRITFFNSTERNFSLKVKGKELDLKRALDDRVTIRVANVGLISILMMYF